MAGDPSPDLSIIILNYNVKDYTEQCILSLEKATQGLSAEIFVVDNASEDGSVPYLQARFPYVRFIANQENVGFARGNNLALGEAQGRYLLILNPDTIVEEDAIKNMIGYLEEHPQVGAVGPKILDRFGRFDHASRRGFPTPWASFTRLSGLSRLFPKSRLLAQYELSFLDPDQPAPIDALSGACMMVRKEVFQTVGGFDEDYFMYGEDIDWSYRIKQAGWQVHYVPYARIIHFRGESVKRSFIDREKAFYDAMIRFIEKHLSTRYPWLIIQLLILSVLCAEALARLKRELARKWSLALDTLGFGGAILCSLPLHSAQLKSSLPLGVFLSVQAVIYLFSLALFGVYSSRKWEFRPLFLGMISGLGINGLVFILFFKPSLSSPNPLFLLFAGCAMWVAGWRGIVKSLKGSDMGRSLFAPRVIIVGDGVVAQNLHQQILASPSRKAVVVRMLNTEHQSADKEIPNSPLQVISRDLPHIISQKGVDMVIFALDQPDYRSIVNIMSRCSQGKSVEFKVLVPGGKGEADQLPTRLILNLSPSLTPLKVVRKIVLSPLRL